MSLMSRFFGNTRRPEGFWGRMVVSGMNGGSHEKLAKWGLSHVRFLGGERVLDCGCGGGANIARMLRLIPNGHVSGLDYSEVSVNKSREVNKKDIAAGRCEIVQGNVADIPFGDAQFDMVTAFETVYFWPDLIGSFQEVCRVLKQSGSFVIVNESNGRNEKSLKWTRIIDGMNVYTGEQLKTYLEGSGFADIRICDDDKNDRITVQARKNKKEAECLLSMQEERDR